MPHDPKVSGAVDAAILAAIQQHDFSDSQLYWMGGPEPSDARAIITTAALDAIEAMGMVVVPVEPTPAMVKAAGGPMVNLERADDPSYRPADVWSDMLDARPGAQP